MDGNLIHKDSDEGKKQLRRASTGKRRSLLLFSSMGRFWSLKLKFMMNMQRVFRQITWERRMNVCSLIWSGFFLWAQEAKPKEGGDDDDEEKNKTTDETGGKTKKLTNQFNFSERASQTYNNPCRVRCEDLSDSSRSRFLGSRNICWTNTSCDLYG